jgi:hypothetical protein
VAAPDAFVYWSDVICDTLVHVAARATSEAPFAGRIEHAALDGIGLSTVVSGAQQVARTNRMIARDQEELPRTHLPDPKSFSPGSPAPQLRLR